MSDTHMHSTFKDIDSDERSVKIKIGAVDKDLPESVYLEAIEAFRHSTEILARYIDGWVFAKDNPEKIAEMKTTRDAK